MPNSLKSRLKKLEHKGLLSEKDLSRIVVIPDNATNGDMIKALFPNALIYVDTTLKKVWFCVYEDKDDEDFDKHVTFPLDWWNAPYKKGE